MVIFSWIESLSVNEVELLAVIETELVWVKMFSANEIELLAVNEIVRKTRWWPAKKNRFDFKILYQYVIKFIIGFRKQNAVSAYTLRFPTETFYITNIKIFARIPQTVPNSANFVVVSAKLIIFGEPFWAIKGCDYLFVDTNRAEKINEKQQCRWKTAKTVLDLLRNPVTTH